MDKLLYPVVFLNLIFESGLLVTSTNELVKTEEFNCSSIVTNDKLAHIKNALSAMLVTLLGMVILWIVAISPALKVLNILSAMFVIDNSA